MTYVHFQIILALCLISVLVNFYFIHRLHRQLQAKYRTVWQALGSPTLILNHSIRNSLATLGFVFRGRYKQFGDAKLAGTCKIIVVMQITCYILIVSTFATALIVSRSG